MAEGRKGHKSVASKNKLFIVEFQIVVKSMTQLVVSLIYYTDKYYFSWTYKIPSWNSHYW